MSIWEARKQFISLLDGEEGLRLVSLVWEGRACARAGERRVCGSACVGRFCLMR